MLVYARMTRASLVAAVLLGSSGVAAAGPYVGLGVGDGVGVSGDYSARGRSYRLLGGYKFGRLSAEASIGTASLGAEPGTDYDALGLTLSGKYNLPLSNGFEVFGRVGLHHIGLDRENSDRDDLDLSGGGLLLGGGVEYRPKLPVSFWLDYTLTYTSSLDGVYIKQSDFTTRQWMLGFTFGI